VVPPVAGPILRFEGIEQSAMSKKQRQRSYIV
jgi:hypothetical protein